jgi:hypothetical protein
VDPSDLRSPLEVPRGMGRILGALVLREAQKHGVEVVPIRCVYPAGQDVSRLNPHDTSTSR